MEERSSATVVDELEAGAELDRLIQVEVMGGSASDKAPPFSSDLGAARTMKSAFLYLNAAGRKGDFTAFASLSQGLDGRLVFAEGWGETVPLALTRAALKAVRGMTGTGSQ